MKFSEELQERGFIHQITAETVGDIVDNGPRVVYHGIDPTADSAHAGNFVSWMLLRHLADQGHRIIFLVGGGTGMIGDPKPDAERTLQTTEQVEHNVAKLKAQAEQIVGGGNSVTFVNNADWLLDIKLVDFLRDIGKHFTVNELIKKEAIARRLEGDAGISYTEFAYPLLQGYDYLQLYREYGCNLQVGGSDQWGNIVAGVELVRRKEGVAVDALTVPLVVDKATGKKFGKSEGNAIWLDAAKTSPYTFYQYWLNVSDESAVDFLKLFTLLPLDEIASVAAEHEADPAQRVAQKRLAFAATAMVHSEEVAEAVRSAAQVLFGSQSIVDVDASVREVVLENAPVTQLQSGEVLLDTLVRSGLASSKREARTFVADGAVSFNDEKVTDIEVVTADLVGDASAAVLRRGKKQLSVLVRD